MSPATFKHCTMEALKSNHRILRKMFSHLHRQSLLHESSENNRDYPSWYRQPLNYFLTICHPLSCFLPVLGWKLAINFSLFRLKRNWKIFHFLLRALVSACATTADSNLLLSAFRTKEIFIWVKVWWIAYWSKGKCQGVKLFFLRMFSIQKVHLLHKVNLVVKSPMLKWG